MNKFQLKYFKAFKNELTIELDNKNLLVYGENGAGKSSLYEAFKIVFFKKQLALQIPKASTPEEQEQFDNTFWSTYNNNSTSRDFEILIEDTHYKDFDKEAYQPFLISIEEIELSNEIRLDKLLENFFFNIPNVQAFCEAHFTEIALKVNNSLKEFKEAITIEIDQEDDYTLLIKDDTRNIETKKELKKFFNEAKLNLVILLLLFNTIKYLIEDTKKCFLLLDDFITSLDVANRTYLMNYIVSEFSDFQILILTHNVNFFNLIKHIVSDIHKESARWNYGNMYEFDGDNKFYIKKFKEPVKEIHNFYKKNPDKIEEVGNKIRKRFEILLYEFSKLLMIGAVEDNKKILERILFQKNRYHKQSKNTSDLVDELHTILYSDNKYNLEDRLKKKILEYQKDDFKNIRYTLTKLKLYQKTTMHPMSHGTLGQTTFSVKEIENSLTLLEKLEKQLKDLVDKDVTIDV
ncbi:AAA family ATPase [Kordia sp.]|uniref:AAA family ATPase n=1 Tax=Kordia sp. TaxID=1965332 RepID=UPI003B5B7B3C